MNLYKNNLTEIFTVQGKIFQIPAFQRPYKWDDSNWNDLFSDIIRVYEKQAEHFMGAVVLQENSKTENSTIVIDGQQRLTTISIFLLAFAKWIKEYNSGNDFLINNTIKNYLITNNKFNGSEIKRITLSNKQDNNKDYQNLINAFYNPTILIGNYKNVFTEAADYFYNEINNYYNEIKDDVTIYNFVNSLYSVISNKLKFVIIQLDENEDANMIFETLNTRGKGLVDGELIRNYIFMHPKIINAEEVYNLYWEPLEKHFEELEEEKVTNFSEFIRFLLYANKNDTKLIRNNHIYQDMKDYLDDYLSEHDILDLLKKIREFKEYFDCIIDPDDIPKKLYSEKIVMCLLLLKYLNTFVYSSIFLKLMEQYHLKLITITTFEEIVLLLTSYSVRLTMNGKKLANKIVPEVILSITDFIDEKSIAEDIEDIINRQKSAPFFDNQTFRKMIIEAPLYSSKKKDFIKYLLLLVFRADTNNRISYSNIEGLTIEHIFPQTFDNWKSDLTIEELEDSYRLLNSIGNLTLISQSLNSKLSNSKFTVKKKELHKYSIWPYEREKYFNDTTDKWNKNTITERANKIADYIIDLLPGPQKSISKDSSENELLIRINGVSIEGKNQKDIYINALQKMYEITDKDKWNRLNIKGCASHDKNHFTPHQRGHLKVFGNIYVNYHASFAEKIRRLKKISQICNIEIEFR